MSDNIDKALEEKLPGTGKTGDQATSEVQSGGADSNLGDMPAGSEGSGHQGSPG